MNNENELIIRPAPIYAFLKIIPLTFAALAFLFLAWSLTPVFILVSVILAALASYRYAWIRNRRFLIEAEFIRIKSGILFKRIDQVEMYRIRDYLIRRPLVHQLFRVMNVMLKTTDPENPVIYLNGIPESDVVDVMRERVQTARKVNKIVEIS